MTKDEKATTATSTVDRETVMRIAKLARIKVPDERCDQLASDLSGMLNWVRQLDEVDTAGVDPMTSVALMSLPMRDDVVCDGACAGKVVGNAGSAEHGFFTVPKVVE
jgi:aspartyl-tRNA(Asn)/glutamyl-tRNA(Gln) amidotransferase subunit C